MDRGYWKFGRENGEYWLAMESEFLSHRTVLLPFAVLFSFFALCASAGAEIWAGSATDPTELGVQPGRDIVAVEVEYYDTTGSLEVEVTTAGPPIEPNTFAVAKLTGGAGCAEPPFAVMGGEYGVGLSAGWVFGSSSGAAYRTVSGNTTTFLASAPQLANQSFRCATFEIYETEPVGGKEVLKDSLAAPFSLAGLMQVPPPPPPPPPPPAPPAVAKLRITTPGAVTLPRNQWTMVPVAIPSKGTAAAAGVVLRIGEAKGVAVKPKSRKLQLGTVPAGSTAIVKFKVRLGPRAKKTSKLPLIVTSKSGIKLKSKLVLKAKKRR